MSNATRESKGRDIADRGDVSAIAGGDGYSVGAYNVNDARDACDCADFTYRGGRCKHIEAADYAIDTDRVVWVNHDGCTDSADCPF